MKEMRIGETLTVISDDEGIRNDMPNWCAMTGHEFLGLSETDGEIRVFMRKAVE
jgi:TusA-related sulfurtransferase